MYLTDLEGSFPSKDPGYPVIWTVPEGHYKPKAPPFGDLLGMTVSTAMVSHAEFMIFGALIVWFLIAEPHGLAKLWSIGKQKLRLWPFPH